MGQDAGERSEVRRPRSSAASAVRRYDITSGCVHGGHRALGGRDGNMPVLKGRPLVHGVGAQRGVLADPQPGAQQHLHGDADQQPLMGWPAPGNARGGGG